MESALTTLLTRRCSTTPSPSPPLYSSPPPLAEAFPVRIRLVDRLVLNGYNVFVRWVERNRIRVRLKCVWSLECLEINLQWLFDNRCLLKYWLGWGRRGMGGGGVISRINLLTNYRFIGSKLIV